MKANERKMKVNREMGRMILLFSSLLPAILLVRMHQTYKSELSPFKPAMSERVSLVRVKTRMDTTSSEGIILDL
jgi:hypothetical protein